MLAALGFLSRMMEIIMVLSTIKIPKTKQTENPNKQNQKWLKMVLWLRLLAGKPDDLSLISGDPHSRRERTNSNKLSSDLHT